MSSDAIVQLLQRSGESLLEAKHEVRKTPKFSYTREFLVSLRELDICKKLPLGFDSSILSEFEDAPSSAFERQRSVGGPLQGSRYGSTSLKRADVTVKFSQGSHGRWDTHSTGSSDKDGESQSDRDSFSQDSGSQYLNQPRRPWQNPERDGLLGSGAFLRPSGQQGGALAPKGRGNGQHQLSKSSERYQPPRPYKATPYSWRDNTDSYNDETFGSSECSSQERAEEERKRRASFELMRKEQHKALQENHKQPTDTHKENLDNDIIMLLGNTKIEKNLKDNREDKLEGNSASLVSDSDSAKGPFPAHTPASRPPVPPGFASTITEKNLGTQTSNKAFGSGVGIVGKSPLLTKSSLRVNGEESNLEKGHDSGIDVHPDRTASKSNSIAVSFADATEHPGLAPEDASVAACGPLGGAGRGWEGVISSSNEEMFTLSGNTDRSEQEHSTSILDKLFDSTSKKDDRDALRSIEGANINEQAWSPTSSQSSKYTHWFSEGDKRPTEDLSSRDLLSLIISKNKPGSETSAGSHELICPSFPFENGESSQESFPSATSCVTRVHESHDHPGKPGTDAGVLTCEDLEQSILADAKESSSGLLDIVQGPWNTVDANPKLQKAGVDDHASQHLLSLLHKGMCSKDLANPELAQTSERPGNVNVKSEVTLMFAGNNFSENAEPVRTEKPLTLEALFGSAFMKELHSMEAPVSGHRGSVDENRDNCAPQFNGISLPHADYISSSSEYSSSVALEGNISLKHTPEARPQKHHETWTGFEDLQSKNSIPPNFVAREEGSLGIYLPEEESLITVGDTVSPIMADPFPADNASKNAERLGSRLPDEILMDKLAALNIPRNNDRYSALELDAPSVHGPYHMVEPGFSYQHARPSSPQFPHPHMDHIRSLFQPSDNPTHRNPLMNFVGPDNMHHDPHLPHHQFPSNNIHHHPFHNPGGPMFDPAIPLPMASPMPVPGNFPPRQPLQGFPRGVPLSPPLNHMPSFMPEMNAMHGFPRQPSYGGFGMGMPGTGASGPGGGDPESFRRLMEMRTNLKQTHASAPGHIPGMYSYELDMGFR
ncbi:hypothetical protein Taro_007015 [Colocasia esculenta]|uniref:Uncharacterized protein n=1 Tax=Colocasia esculenta TaxID=4460 RepID=A0A843TXP9_COLES|nr:hypothetical protein [Colocasia esculenta]